MRQVGTIPDEQQARRFADYLLTLGIETSVERDDSAWGVWIIQEKELARGKEELGEFLAAPDDIRYRKVEKQAEEIRRVESKKGEQQAQNVIDMRRRWQKSTAGKYPLTIALMIAAVVVAIFTEFGSRKKMQLADRWLFIARIERQENIVRWQGLEDIRQGEIWRLVSPIFVHYGLLHLLFNMFCLYDFGPLIETRRRSWRLLLLVLVTAAVSNLGEYAWRYAIGHPTPLAGGMSGVIYGLFGYIWMKSRHDPAAGMFLQPRTVVILLVWLVLCMTGILARLFGIHVANAAHAAGLATGLVIGFAPVAWRRLHGRR